MGWLDTIVNTNAMHVVHNLKKNINSVKFCPLAPPPPYPHLPSSNPTKKVGTYVLVEIMNDWQCVTGVTNFWDKLLLTEIKTTWVTHLYWVGFV